MKKKNNPIPPTFEEYMKAQHRQIFPEVLDDDLPDSFDEWVAGLQADDWLEWGDIYAGLRSCHDRSDMLHYLTEK